MIEWFNAAHADAAPMNNYQLHTLLKHLLANPEGRVALTCEDR